MFSFVFRAVNFQWEISQLQNGILILKADDLLPRAFSRMQQQNIPQVCWK